jgi:hypothetical protein
LKFRFIEKNRSLIAKQIRKNMKATFVVELEIEGAQITKEEVQALLQNWLETGGIAHVLVDSDEYDATIFTKTIDLIVDTAA